jgi:uncharacterized protein YkwD
MAIWDWLFRRRTDPTEKLVLDPSCGCYYSAKLVRLHNDIRKNLAPLSISMKLNAAAQKHADYLAARSQLNHDYIESRISETGYRFRAIGENVGLNVTAEGVMQGWMESPKHYANIMHGSFRDMGCGIARNTRTGYIYWVVTFGTPV